MNPKSTFIHLLCMTFIFVISTQASIAQPNSGSSMCGTPVITFLPPGLYQLCIQGGAAGTISSHYGSFSLSCAGGTLDGYSLIDGCFHNVPCCPEGNQLSITWTLLLTSGGSVNCSSVVTLPECDNEPCEPDTDEDGICDPVDCWPNDPTITVGPGDPCDDGNPLTVDDTYNHDCDCVGNPIGDPCEPDTDGDGVCDPVDCWPTDPNLTYGPGYACDDDNPLTVNDTYDEDCNCIGEPNNCVNVDPDDDCPLTVDIVNADCTVTNIPPNPDDGCPLTIDYFDSATCTIVNVPPDPTTIDDGCSGTTDFFDPLTCQIVHTSLPCDDGDPNTVDDEYDENCECRGYEPCERGYIDWNQIIQLLSRN